LSNCRYPKSNCLKTQSFHRPRDEVPMLQARTLPPVPFPHSASPDDLQRVGPAPNDYSQTFAAFSRQPHRKASCSIGIQKLLNPVGCQRRSNPSRGLSLSLLSTGNAGPLISSKSDTHSLSLAGPSSYRPVSQDTPYSPAQNCERTRGINPEAPQPASQAGSVRLGLSSHHLWCPLVSLSTITLPRHLVPRRHCRRCHRALKPSKCLHQMQQRKVNIE